MDSGDIVIPLSNYIQELTSPELRTINLGLSTNESRFTSLSAYIQAVRSLDPHIMSANQSLHKPTSTHYKTRFKQ